MSSIVRPPDRHEAVDGTAPSIRVRMAAPPLVAAAFGAGIIYLWLEAAFRLVFTYNTAFNNAYMLWNGRVGDIAAMWLTISGVALAAFFVLGFGVFRGRAQVGTIPVWTILLIVSAIAAPIIGEIGTPIGT